jgi:hypothetical protein
MNEQKEEPKEDPEYGSFEFADAKYVRKIDERKTTFCPISNGTCQYDCVSYVEPQVVNEGTKETPFWICKGGFCSAYMLVGPT